MVRGEPRRAAPYPGQDRERGREASAGHRRPPSERGGLPEQRYHRPLAVLHYGHRSWSRRGVTMGKGWPRRGIPFQANRKIGASPDHLL